ncbi:unnamed protein product, partial [Scytosiphon promiscuus]
NQTGAAPHAQEATPTKATPLLFSGGDQSRLAHCLGGEETGTSRVGLHLAASGSLRWFHEIRLRVRKSGEVPIYLQTRNKPNSRETATLAMMANADFERDGASLADEAGGGEMDELLLLLEQKDSDLRRAAELGKMLLDEKEADAEAHEGEKEALWRRIQDMARRVMELEQEAAEKRDSFSVQHDHHHHHHHGPAPASDGGGSWGGRRFSSSSGGSVGGDRAEERALRAKNEMLERQLAHMKELAEETQLELAAAKKARFFRKSSSHRHSRAGSGSLMSSPALSPRKGRGDRSFSGGAFSSALGALSPTGPLSPERFSAAVSGSGGHLAASSDRRRSSTHSRPSSARLSSPTELSRWSVPSPPSPIASLEEGEGRGGEERGGRGKGSMLLRIGGGVGDGEDSEASNDELRDAAWLLEQNAWLMEELEAKDELIEALREQIVQQQGRWGGQGTWPSSSVQSLRDLADTSSDPRPVILVLLSPLLLPSPPLSRPLPTHSGPTWISCCTRAVPTMLGTPRLRIPSPGVASPAGGIPAASTARRASLGGGDAAAPDVRRSFGGVLAENAMQDAGKPGAEGATERARMGTQVNRSTGSSVVEGMHVNVPIVVHGTPPQSLLGKCFSGLAIPAASCKDRKREMYAGHRAVFNASLSPARSGAEVSSGGVTGVVGKDDGDAVGNSSGGVHGHGCGSTVAVVAAEAHLQDQPGASPASPVAVETPRVPATVPGTASVESVTARGSNAGVAVTEADVAATQREALRATAEKTIAPPSRAPLPPPPPLAQMNRAERKSRQAMEKLGLRSVSGVFRMTMKTTNGVVFIVKAPDVFKHPKKSTYVVFGSAETDRSGSEVRPPSPRKLPFADAAMSSGPSARPDPSAVEAEAVAAGLDPADVLTVVTQAGCSSTAAILALRQADSDVVNAVMGLT